MTEDIATNKDRLSDCWLDVSSAQTPAGFFSSDEGSQHPPPPPPALMSQTTEKQENRSAKKSVRTVGVSLLTEMFLSFNLEIGEKTS